MQNPYIVGRWVRGSDHYDRQGLTEYLLTAQDTAIWVMGARRMGKTSLLRHLEHITDPGSGPAPPGAPAVPANSIPHVSTPFIPLYWDLQGCVTQEELGTELYHALEDVSSRFADLGIDIDTLSGLDAVDLLRRINRSLAASDRQLLLLVDEAEVLVSIAQVEPAWLARLRKVFQEGRQRTIIASTKLLATMTERSVDWVTSPFLFGFHLVNLHALEEEGAVDLVRQTQAKASVQVHDTVLDQILSCTNGHPYLIQYLCQRLFVPVSDEQGYLRDLQEKDLLVDPLMASLFEVDIGRLTTLERRLLLGITRAGRCSKDALVTHLDARLHAALPACLRSLEEFGHIRCVEGLWEAGNEFLYRWLLSNHTRLWSELEADELAGDTESDEVAQLARLLGIAPERIRALLEIKISSPEQFFKAIQGFFIQIRHLVEQDDGHRLLLTSGETGELRLRSEDEVQIALKLWLRPMCRALNIHMDREPLTGRGLLDFKFSLGHDLRCLVEVKLFNNTRLQDGVNIQLPIYLMADDAHYGIFVPIFLESTACEPSLERLTQAAQQQAERHGVQITVIDIRAWKPKTASRADSADEFKRYRLPLMLGDEEL